MEKEFGMLIISRIRMCTYDSLHIRPRICRIMFYYSLFRLSSCLLVVSLHVLFVLHLLQSVALGNEDTIEGSRRFSNEMEKFERNRK